jgi:hypothetical protein
MSRDTPSKWTQAQADAYAARHRLAPPPDLAELQRLCEVGDRVAAVGASIPRMPRKTDEPASVFTVPS